MKKKQKKPLPVVSRPVVNPRGKFIFTGQLGVVMKESAQGPIITAPDGQPKPVPPKPVLHPRAVIEAQLQNLFLVYGTLITLEKALKNSDGEHDLAYADCVKSCHTMLDVSLGVFDDLTETLPKEKECDMAAPPLRSARP